MGSIDIFKPLSALLKAAPSINPSNIKNYWEKLLGMPGIEPGAVGLKARMPSLCYSAPQVFVLRYNGLIMFRHLSGTLGVQETWPWACSTTWSWNGPGSTSTRARASTAGPSPTRTWSRSSPRQSNPLTSKYQHWSAIKYRKQKKTWAVGHCV